MATREKTVVFAFPMTTALVADATLTTLTQITVYVPESSPTFTSVFVEVGFQDAITATGGTINEHRCAVRLGAAAYMTVTETDDITNTGENIAGVVGPFDFTSHFNTNWSGTSMTCDCQVYFDQNSGTTLGMNNVTALLYVTYTYDDTEATQIKTVRLPMESLVGTLPTSASNFGSSQIPQLTSGGILPENSPTIRDWFIVIEGNENNNNTTTDFTVSVNIDGGATTTFMNQEAALGSDRFCRWIYRPSVPDTTTSHNLQMWSSVTNKCNHVTATLFVTYEFTLSGTTQILNSVLTPFEIASPLGLSTSGNASRYTRQIPMLEPGTLTLRQSAFRLNWNCVATLTAVNLRAGGQSYRAYTSLASGVCGMFSVQHRIDSGSAQGAGFTLARGFNTITIDGYSTNTAQEATNLNGYMIINYESDIPTEGVGAANHTVMKVLKSWDALLTDLVRISSFSFAIPETDYRLVSGGFCLIQWLNASTGLSFDLECQSGEGKGAGYYDIYTDIVATDAEIGCSMVWMQGRDTFKRFPQDVGSDRVDIETARDYRMMSATTGGKGIIACATYYSMTWDAAGNISGNDVGLPTDLKLVRASNDEVLQEQTLSAGTTAFTFTCYDDTEDYYIDAYQDDTHVGRSGLEKAA